MVVPTSASATLADALVLVGALVCYQVKPAIIVSDIKEQQDTVYLDI